MWLMKDQGNMSTSKNQYYVVHDFWSNLQRIINKVYKVGVLQAFSVRGQGSIFSSLALGSQWRGQRENVQGNRNLPSQLFSMCVCVRESERKGKGMCFLPNDTRGQRKGNFKIQPVSILKHKLGFIIFPHIGVCDERKTTFLPKKKKRRIQKAEALLDPLVYLSWILGMMLRCYL